MSCRIEVDDLTMSEQLKSKLSEFILGKLSDSGKPIPEDFNSSTPLITSGLLESLYLLELAVFIEAETNATLDMTTLDFATEWNTIDSIISFLDSNKAS